MSLDVVVLAHLVVDAHHSIGHRARGELHAAPGGGVDEFLALVRIVGKNVVNSCCE